MTAVAHVTDQLIGLLPRLSRTAQIVDEAARLGQYPSGGLVDNVVDQAHVLQGAAMDLAAAGGYEQLARTLGTDALSVARKGGVMHSMSQHGNYFSGSWRGSFDGVVRDVEAAVRQLT